MLSSGQSRSISIATSAALDQSSRCAETSRIDVRILEVSNDQKALVERIMLDRDTGRTACKAGSREYSRTSQRMDRLV
jgi:hypothetical protein